MIVDVLGIFDPGRFVAGKVYVMCVLSGVSAASLLSSLVVCAGCLLLSRSLQIAAVLGVSVT